MNRSNLLRLTPRRAILLRVSEQLPDPSDLAAASPLLLAPPRRGWIRHVRDALNMSAHQLATRVGVSRGTLARFEHNERAETIQLQTLRRVADALGCDLVYGFAPRCALTELVDRQVRKAAAAVVEQALPLGDPEEVIRDLLYRQPGWIWGGRELPELIDRGT